VSVNQLTKRFACYVINLPRDHERRDRMEKLLNHLQIEFTIIDAAVGASLSPEELQFFQDRTAMQLVPAEFGCMVSHINCWRRFLHSDADFALVCEDDIHISPHLKTTLEALEYPTDDNSIVRLESFGSFTTFAVEPRQKIGHYGIHKMLSDHGGAACYLISRKTAQYLLDAAPHFRNAVDIEMFFPKRTSVTGLNVFQLIPALAIQDQILTTNRSTGFLKSNMGRERADAKLWRDRNLFQVIKGRIRPYYQMAYSAYLRVTLSRMRLIVPFR